MRILSQFGATDLKPSALGFGCAALMSRIGRRQSLRCLNHALDAGINYFDVARVYGFGEAESVVGEFARRRRDQIIIATKVGRPVTRLPLVKRLVISYARPLYRFASRRQRLGKLRTGPPISTNATSNILAGFRPEELRNSFEESLKQLDTDYVDVLLLHDPPSEVIQHDGLARFLEDVVTSGKARNVGTTGTALAVTNALKASSVRVDVAQFENNVVRPQLQVLPEDHSQAVATHSPFARGQRIVHRVAEFLEQHPAVLRHVAERMDSTASGTTPLAGALLLNYALTANSTGVVLCGMYRREQIEANARVADLVAEPLLDDRTLSTVRDWIRPSVSIEDPLQR